jgi:rSAM/selenodomain-associated transferase 2
MISFIIPTWNESEALGSLLTQLSREHPQAEIIVADGGSTDGTPDVARRLGARVISCERPSRGRQLNTGARAAGGRVLCFLHADVLPPPGAGDQIEAAMQHEGVIGGGFRIAYDRDHPALRLLAVLSGLPWRTAYFGDQGFFCRAEAYRQIGGVPDWPLFEDVALAYALARRGRLVRVPEATRASARRFIARGPWRQLMLNAGLWFLFHLGVSPHRLAGWYR